MFTDLQEWLLRCLGIISAKLDDWGNLVLDWWKPLAIRVDKWTDRIVPIFFKDIKPSFLLMMLMPLLTLQTLFENIFYPYISLCISICALVVLFFFTLLRMQTLKGKLVLLFSLWCYIGLILYLRPILFLLSEL